MSRTWALLERVDAPHLDDPSKTAMVRWRIIQTPLFGIYMHRLDTADQRPTLHDHPWPFLSLVLRGGYTEELGHTTHRHGTVTTSRRHGRVVERLTRTWRAGSIHRIRADNPHTITELHRSPTWTLVLAGPRAPAPSWGYWDEHGWTPWHTHPLTVPFETAQAARQALMATVRSDGGVRAARVLRRIAAGLLLVSAVGLGFALSQGAWVPAALELAAGILAGALFRRSRRQIKQASGRLGVAAG